MTAPTKPPAESQINAKQAVENMRPLFETWQGQRKPHAASLAQAVKAGLAKRFPGDPPMEIVEEKLDKNL